MRARGKALISGLTSTALVAGAWMAVPTSAWAGVSPGAPVVINEVYGGGGNAGATYKQDFIELYNKSNAAVSLAGWSVQYASATGTSWATTPLTGTLPAGSHYVVREAQGAGGTTDVPSDVTGTIAMGGTAGKVALVNTTGALTCGADCDGSAAVVDFVGYGTTANDFAGTGPTPAPSNTNAVSRNAAHDNTANNAADFAAGAPSPVACGTACTTVTPPPDPTVEKTIAEIQGPGAESPLAGSTVTTKGIVTAAYPTGGFRGYYIQTPGTGGPVDPATDTTSDGIFVFQSTGAFPAAIEIGNYVQVTGGVTEFFGMTQLTVAAADVVDLADPPAGVTAATTSGWPTTNAARESLEGMLYRPTGAYTVTNTFTTNQFGEVGLASGTKPLMQRTEVEEPGPAAASAVEADNAARRVTLDDGSTTNFLATSGGVLVNGALTPPYVSQSAPVRVGAPATFTSDVIVDWRNSAWKFQPTTTVTGPANANSPASFANTRTAAPDEALIGNADLKIASFNVLNYFTTLGTDDASCTSFKDRDGNGATVNGGCDQRGAWDSEDLARQQVKIVKAINALDADVVGLMEIENSARLGETPDEATNTLVAALNADAGAGTWAANPSSAELPPVAEMDFITNAIIYKPAAVTRVGDARALGTASSAGEAFDNAREPVAQVFSPVAGGGKFLFVVNHFKSKGSAGPWPGDADTGDGQGASNESRVRQATALRDWIPTVLPATGTKAVMLAGDFNAYAKEDPLDVLSAAGYTNVEQHFGHGEYSYSFSGLAGSLDHVLVNADALKRTTGADVWNINSGESLALEYSRWNYHGTDFHVPDAYRSSDHDPVVVGLTASSPAKTVQVLGINDFHGRIQASGIEAGAAVLAGAVKQLRTQYPDTVFAAAGDLIGASTFESFIAQDKPTIDALNEAGLEVSAVGNHEFDQGYDDLINRVMAPYNAETNPYGGAAWEYLGANVRHADDHSAALPETWIQDFDGVQVGFVGAVTDHLSELVSPDGIAGLEIESPVVAANRHANELKAAGAEIVVLLVHEGAETTALSSATNPATDFGKIVTGVNDNVDAIVSGHTHLAYNHSVTVPGWVNEGRAVTTRPVVSAGQYGYNLNQLLFTVDSESGDVTGLQQNILPLVKTPAYPTDAPTKAIVDKAVADAAVRGAEPLGELTGPFNRAKLSTGAENRGGESTLGNLVAEVQQTATEGANTGAAQIAFMNPGGLRADMVGSSSTYPNTLTYRQAANVQPFANTLVNLKLTGAQLKTALEQQWQPAGSARPFLRLGISEGFTYTYDPRAAAGSRITAMWLNGTAIDPAASYSVTVNSFLAAGGDNFGVFAQGANKKDTGQTDLQAMVDYMDTHTPVSPDYTQRSVGVMFPAGAPASYYPGDQVNFDLSSLAYSTPADRKDTAVDVSLGDTALGSFAVNNAIGTTVTDEYGTASVSFTLPAGVPAGQQNLTVKGAQTGTTTTVPITVAQLVSTTTTLTASATSQTYGTSTPATLTATVAQSDGAEPSGSVRFEAADGTVLATVAVSSGQASHQLSATAAAGTYQFTATFVPSAATVTGSTSQALQFTVNKAVSTTGLTAKVLKSKGKYEIQMTATVSLNTGKPAVGTVAFYLKGVVVAQAQVGADGRATVTVPAPKERVQVRAVFTPTDTANHLGSTSPTLTVNVA
ncbi:MAG TPA: ExeM/NucH family extracellular endonuclease [Jatrophihabitans sp.]|jgi:5'-nucleotidase|uniref:ExeM/NucH family extracellular endonuclease n=1 Tax=Jatrophihabitans sp. TaxID=1932789 RepID=UPI002F0291A4